MHSGGEEFDSPRVHRNKKSPTSVEGFFVECHLLLYFYKKGNLSTGVIQIKEKGNTVLHTANTQTGLWVDLLKEAEDRAQIKLTENQESYLVFMLMRFIAKCELLSTTLALQYLESMLERRKVQEVMLADTADTSLIFAGLFPERSKKLNVSSAYFMNISRSCFLGLADLCENMKHKGEATLYREIGTNIEKLTHVLYCTRVKNVANLEMFRVTGKEIIH